MIHLHYSNSFEALIAPLADSVTSSQERAPLERVVVVVPNRVVEDYLKLRLSERLGVAANLDFPFLRSYLARLVNKADPALCVLESEDLEILLFERLREIGRGAGVEFEPVRAYLRAGSRSEADAEVRALQLAGQVARMFREYSISRRTMLERWPRGALLAETAFASTERWQRALWQSVFDANGAVRGELIEMPEPRRLLLPDAFEILRDDALRDALPPALHIFGSGYAGPAFAKIFARLARLTNLHIHALNPCAEFWDDIDIPGGIDRARLVQRHSRVGTKLDTESDPFAIESSGDTPALRLWSRPGREYIRLLNELSDCDFDAHFVRRAGGTGATLLQQVQDDILIRAPERKPIGEDASQSGDDGSIRFLACPGIRREAEIIANEVWSIVRGAGDIRFHQIAVAVPDRLWPDYQPHLETAFSELHQLPVNMVNSRFASESRVAQAVAMLLRLPLGNFGRYEMLHLLNHPAISADSADGGTARWAEWCDALGVFFGADERDLAGTYIPPGVFHWDQALKRLALGAFMSGERSADDRFFEADREAQYLPLELPQDEIAGAARMIHLARALIADAIEIRARRLSLPEWARLLTKLVLTYVNCADAIDERVRDWCVAAIDSIAASSIRSAPVLYQTAYELAIARIAEAESMRGRFAETGVAIGPLSALRSIPFRAIFLAGLNESQFPERARHDPLDLRLAQHKAGDVTPASRDRYLFLETLLAARERMVFAYVARDAQTGEPLEPSTIVRELQFILRGYLDEKALEKLTIDHPVSRYDFRYFPELAQEKIESPLQSVDPSARAGARMAALRRDLQAHCGDLALGGRDASVLEKLSDDARAKLEPVLPIIEMPRVASPKTGATKEIWLPLSALRRFLECPIQGAAKYALGMSDDDSEALAEDQDEPLEQSRVTRAMLLREAFRSTGGDPANAMPAYRRAYRLAQAHGKAPAGVFEDAERAGDQERLLEWFAQARAADATDLAHWIDVRFGRAGEFARADCVLKEIEFELCDRRGEAVRVRLYGSAGTLARELNMSIHGILRPERRPYDFLPLVIPAIALAAAGRRADSFRAIVVAAAGNGKQRIYRDFIQPAPADACRYLKSLAQELLFGENHYFLPLEAVAAVNRALERRADDPEKFAAVSENDRIEEAIENIRENEFARCRSDFGPVRNARRFEPPEPAMAKKIIERRFAPIAVIFR